VIAGPMGRRLAAFLVALIGAIGAAGPAHAATGVLRVLVSGALSAPSEFVQLTAVDFGGGVYLVYACAFPQLPGGIACPLGGSSPVAHLSGRMIETDGGFLGGSIAGVDATDLVLTLIGSLP